MIIKQIKEELLKVDILLKEINCMTHKYEIIIKDHVLAFGWDTKDTKKTLGFWGVMGPSFDEVVTPQPFSDSLFNSFQFYVSDHYYWYSPPSKNILGYSCKPLSDINPLVSDLLFFTKVNFDSDKWDIYYKTSKHNQINR